MLFRNLLLVLGALFVLAGGALGVIWLRQERVPVQSAEGTAQRRTEILSAAHVIPSGTLLQAADTTWKEIEPSQLRPGNIVRGQTSEAEFLGAFTTRDFASGEALVASDLIKVADRRFLAAVLKPGLRAASIFVDAAQSSSGLLLPGNHVDVILTQVLEESGNGPKKKTITETVKSENTTKETVAETDESANNPKKQTVAETVLEDVRIIAVDQTLSQQPKAGLEGAIDARTPKTVTLELTERQAEKLSVAEKLGQIQISVRPLENAASAAGAEDRRSDPVWGGDVSQALKKFSRLQEDLAREIQARKLAEKAAQEKLARETAARNSAEKTAEAFKDELAKAQEAIAASQRLIPACMPGQRPPCGTGSSLESSLRWPPRLYFPAQNPVVFSGPDSKDQSAERR
jgi:pilus assembly protein CpaB